MGIKLLRNEGMEGIPVGGPINPEIQSRPPLELKELAARARQRPGL